MRAKNEKTVAIQIPRLVDEGYGVQSYIRNVLTAFSELNSNWRMVATAVGLRGRSTHERQLPQANGGIEYRWVNLPKSLFDPAMQYFSLAETFYGSFDVLHSMDLSFHAPDIAKPFTFLVYDLLVFRPELGEYDDIARQRFDKQLRHLIERASAIFSISDFSKRELIRFTGVDEHKVFVAHNGVDTRKFHPPTTAELAQAQEVLQKYKVQNPYLMAAGGRPKRKNLARLLRAFALAREKGLDLDLVICGGGEPVQNDLQQALEQMREPGAVRLLGYVSDRDLCRLLQSARAFVFPSFYEGFGLPPLEAMACGVPVAVADATAIPEVVGQAGVYFDPHDEEDLANALLRLEADDALRARCIDSGLRRAAVFTWSAHVEKLVLTWNQLTQ